MRKWSALDIVLQHGEQLLLATESMETALKKVDRVMDDMRYQQCNNTYFLVTPVELEEITEEQYDMRLDRSDLIIIAQALNCLIQAESNPIGKLLFQGVKSAVADILTEYPNASVFEVKPNMLEE